jgi:hypothetical protein
MAFDSRSLERLQELGRQLPQPLPTPKAKPAKQPAALHRVETEENPEELFRQLVKVSPDGKVPDHLLARLREMEAKAKPAAAPKAAAAAAEPAKAKLQQLQMKQQQQPANKLNPDSELYTAFQQLLLEEDD